MLPRERLIFAVDVATRNEAERLFDTLAPHIGVAKIGLELFVAEGPDIVRAARAMNLPVFLDLKLHDIPETVERAVGRAVDLDVRFLTVHASGAPKMLERAAKRCEGSRTEIVAVTVLTSLDAHDLGAIGIERAPGAQAALLAKTAERSGISSLVCSPQELADLRGVLAATATLITPGVRPRGASASDQKRTATCEEAIAAGADYVVVGRPIRDAAAPGEAADALVREIEAGMKARVQPTSSERT